MDARSEEFTGSPGQREEKHQQSGIRLIRGEQAGSKIGEKVWGELRKAGISGDSRDT